MGNPLKNPPVYFTVAQARFNAILNLGEYLPSIQDAMRKASFSDFLTRKSVVIQINMQDGQAMPTPAARESFFFGTADKKHCFVLSTEALTLQSTSYGTFEEFSRRFLDGLDLIDKAVQLDFTERVGLRYLDHIAPRNSETLDKYLASEVLGLSARIGGEPIHSFSETFNSVGDVRLLTRVVIQNGTLSFPPDLQPEGMAVESRFLAHAGHHALLDTDGSIEKREVFASEVVGQQLNAIHDVVRVAFRATVTEHALDVWNEQ